MKNFAHAAACIALLCLAAAAAGSAADVFRVSDRSAVPLEQMMEDLRSVDIIYVGELHHMKEHHRLELEIIRMLHESDIPLAVGLEMFRAEDQRILDAWTGGTLGTGRFIASYYENWTLPWPLYEDIFLYAREHRIPLVGLNIPSEVPAAVAKSGFAALPDEQRKHLPRGLSCNVDPKYRKFIERAYAGHGAHSRKQFEHFCEAQLVWDKSMAWNLIAYRKAKPGVKMVVLSGLGHAWRSGMPEQVSREDGAASRVVLPMIDRQITPATITADDADYLVY